MWFQGAAGVLNCDCGCPTKEQACVGQTGRITSTCTNCGNPITFDCGDPGTPPPVTPPPGTPPPPPPPPTGCPYTSTQARFKPSTSASDPWIGNNASVTEVDCYPGLTPEFTFAGFHDQDATRGFPSDINLRLSGPGGLDETLSQGDTMFLNTVGTYTLTATTSGFSGEANCQDTVQFACVNRSTPPPVAPPPGTPPPPITPPINPPVIPPPPGEQGISVVKESNGICLPGGDHSIGYTITITNIGDIPAVYSSVSDIIQGVIEPSYVSDISHGGSLSGNTINWSGGTLTVDESISLTYTLRIPANQVAQFSTTGLLNTVTVSYDSDSDNPKVVSYTNLELVICDLPNTNMSDYIMYGVTLILFSIAALLYQYKVGNAILIKGLTRINDQKDGLFGKLFDRVGYEKKKNSPKFENKVIEKNQDE